MADGADQPGVFRGLYSLDRLRGFSDCVFAVGITLVVASFRLPQAKTLDNLRLDRFLEAQWPTYVAFLAGFVVIGYYWLSHHRLFELLVRADGRLVWLNFGVLFFVVLLPFPTETLGKYREFPEAYLVFNAVACLLGVMNAAMWHYAVGKHRLVSPLLDSRALLIYRLRAAWLPLVFGASFALSFWTPETGVPWAAVACWALLPVGRPLIRLVWGAIPYVETDAEATEVDVGVTADSAIAGAPERVAVPPIATSSSPGVGVIERMFRSTSSMGRLLSFSDNVYAFAITLLGSRLTVPFTESTHTNDDLRRAINDLTSPAFASFVLTFMVIAVFWTVHHRAYLAIERQDGTLRVLNLLHLMAIAVLPFSTDLLSTFSDDQAPFILYALTVELASASLAVIVTYAATDRRLVDPTLPDELIRQWLVMAWLTPVVFLLAIPLCFVSVWWAWTVWVIPPVVLYFIRRRARHEFAPVTP